MYNPVGGKKIKQFTSVQCFQSYIAKFFIFQTQFDKYVKEEKKKTRLIVLINWR